MLTFSFLDLCFCLILCPLGRLNLEDNDIGLSLRNDLGCKKSEILHSDIITGRSFIPRMVESNNTKILGVVERIQDCIALCCSSHDCNMVSFKNGTCFGAQCLDPSVCSLENASRIDDGAQLSLVIRKNKMLSNQTYLSVYSILIITCFLVCMVGTSLCIVIFYKKSKQWNNVKKYSQTLESGGKTLILKPLSQADSIIEINEKTND